MHAATSLILPWEKADAFPAKPEGEPFGYFRRRKPVPCTQDDLVQRCGSQDLPTVTLVWHPDAPRAVPAGQVPFLTEAVRAREIEAVRRSTRWAVGSIVLWAMSAFAACLKGEWDPSIALMIFFGGVLPVIQGRYELRRLLHSAPGEEERNARSAAFTAWLSWQRSYCSWFLAGLLTVIGVGEIVGGLEGPIQRAGLDKAAVGAGQWWRLITGPLLHANLMHFAMNAAALLGLGGLIEALATPAHVLVVLFLSTLSGSLASLGLSPGSTSVGISGGVLGLMGFLFVLARRYREQLPRGLGHELRMNLVWVAMAGVIGYPLIDNGAHLGGFVGGLACGCLLLRERGPWLPLARGFGLTAAGALALLALTGAAILTLKLVLPF